MPTSASTTTPITDTPAIQLLDSLMNNVQITGSSSAPPSPTHPHHHQITIIPPQDEERHVLLAKVIELTEALENEQEIRQELEVAKRALVAEVEELSEALFEEAGSMVAKEARARADVESSRKRLEEELADTRERLEYQTEQLEELRQRILQMSISNSNISLQEDTDLEETAAVDDGRVLCVRRNNVDPDLLVSMRLQSVRSYCEVLFADQRFSSRRCRPELWSTVLEDLMHTEEYVVFGDFCGRLATKDFTSSTITGHAWYRAVIEGEVETALWFEKRSRGFGSRVVKAMLSNECTIERSPIQATASLIDRPRSSSPQTSPIKTRKQQAYMGIFSRLTDSVTSLPDVISGSSSTHPRQGTTSGTCSCYLCSSEDCNWRLQLSINESNWRRICDSCRDRLVSVGDFCAFLRHIRTGLYISRPTIDLFAESLHHRRNIFYTRTHSLPFFTISDFDQFQRRLVTRRRQHNIPRPAPDNPDE
jgi:hypothetical protein